MKTQAAKARRSRSRVAVLLGLVALLGLAPAAEATRTMPDFVRTFEPGPPAAIEVFEALGHSEKPDDAFAVFDEDDVSTGATFRIATLGLRAEPCNCVFDEI